MKKLRKSTYASVHGLTRISDTTVIGVPSFANILDFIVYDTTDWYTLSATIIAPVNGSPIFVTIIARNIAFFYYDLLLYDASHFSTLFREASIVIVRFPRFANLFDFFFFFISF